MSADQKELRGLADADLVRALDAIALAKGLDRNAYVNKVLSSHVASYFNELRLVQTMCRDNPLLAEDAGK
jgi:hypothetical protein